MSLGVINHGMSLSVLYVPATQWQGHKNNYSLFQIGTADQIPLTFDLPLPTTITTKRSKSVSIKTTGNEKNRFSDVKLIKDIKLFTQRLFLKIMMDISYNN